MWLALALVALVPHLGALANGFAWDDVFIVLSNPAVRDGDPAAALTRPWWPAAFTFAGSGLWRPFTSAALAAQWALWGERPLLFHAVGLALHVAVVLLLFAVLRRHVGRAAAWAGAAVFAVHPVHVEAVANGVGQAELWAALFVLIAVLAHGRWLEETRVGARVGLLLLVAAAYLGGVASKEIAVTLPALLLLLPDARGRRPERALPLLGLLGAVLVFLLAQRLAVVGSVRGEVLAPELIGLSTGARVLSGLSAWTDHARLLLFPLHLSADYGPAVRFPATGVDGGVLLGAAVLAAALAGAWAARARPLLAAGLLWTVVALLPVSNLIIPAGVLVAERTLYLPSVGLALGVAGAWAALAARWPGRTLPLALALVLTAGAARSALRVPVWASSDAVLASLERDHPGSHLVLRRQAARLLAEGRLAEAQGVFDRALALVPRHFSLLTEAAQVASVAGDATRAETLAARGVDVYPTSPHGYVVLARVRRRAGDEAGARAALLEGIRRADPLTPLWTELEAGRTMTDVSAVAHPPEELR
ncbi:MAG: hypothetical protein KC645_15790 [Gemmatimonadetes bacterium]|nr:hypothetical protein [Gemmatimonadota bacterium]